MKMYKSVFKEDVLDEIDISSIDLTPLEQVVSKKLGTNIKFELIIEKGYARKYLRVKSQELLKYAGIFKNLLSTCYADTFDSDIGGDKKNVWWQTIGLSYKLTDGGRNGIKILTALYNFSTKKWDFK